METDTAIEANLVDEKSGPSEEPVGVREIAAAVVWVALADLLIFRGMGFTGPAVFVSVVPVIFAIASPGFFARRVATLISAMAWLVAMRMTWQGDWLTILSSLGLVVALAMTASGSVPLVLESITLASRCIVDGANRLGQYRLPRRVHQSARQYSNALAFLIPVAAVFVFGSIFIFANPDLYELAFTKVNAALQNILQWLRGTSVWEVPFCVLALLLGVGLMRPAWPIQLVGDAQHELIIEGDKASSSWYAIHRNTLITLTGLFLVYLCFEFTTLWRREFPAGFYYAGYAHQGAAWLTFALALATGLLSLIFRGSMLQDSRIDWVRKLAWIWSATNFFLAIAVYNRLLIYVGYNGMTRMRMVGLFGITAVVIGFALVLYKIGKARTFWWLIRAQLVAVVLVFIAYSVTPVDFIAHNYNAKQIQSGRLHPAVMIAVKPIHNEGYFPLLGLVETQDPVIRNGILALLAQKQKSLAGESASEYRRRNQPGAAKESWTAFQMSKSRLQKALKEQEARWTAFQNPTSRDAALSKFREYSMQWY